MKVLFQLRCNKLLSKTTTIFRNFIIDIKLYLVDEFILRKHFKILKTHMFLSI